MSSSIKREESGRSFKRYVQVGRVILINQGEFAGKLAVIVEIIDHNKAIIEGPGVTRQALRYRYASLTPHVVSNLPRASNSATVKKYFEKSGVAEKWAESSWAKKRQSAKARSEMSDFDRFNATLLKKQRRRIINGHAKKATA